MKRLNLGSGNDYKEGWVNLDLSNKDIYGNTIKTDIVHDLNKYPYPFKDNSFDEIFMKGVLEYIKDLDKGIKELARISKSNAIIKIQVPYFTSFFAYRELYTHKFSLNCSQLFEIFHKNNLKLISKRLEHNNNPLLKWINSLINNNEFSQKLYERFLSGIIPCTCIWFELENKKGLKKEYYLLIK